MGSLILWYSCLDQHRADTTGEDPLICGGESCNSVRGEVRAVS